MNAVIIESILIMMNNKESFIENNSTEKLSMFYDEAKAFIKKWDEHKKKKYSIPSSIVSDLEICNEYISFINSIKR